MIGRRFDPTRDREAARRIWLEIGWLHQGREHAQDIFFEFGAVWVADIRGEAECLVITAPGTLRYLTEDIPLSLITTVTTSRLARKAGLASRLTAEAIAHDALAGAAVSALGMFDQGYYNQLGFGTGTYELLVGFDPAQLDISVQPRTPRRLTADDWQAVHAARLARPRGHGACSMLPAALTHAAMRTPHTPQDGFGFGYFDGPAGELSHHLWCGSENIQHGPYRISWMVYHTRPQFLELMALLQSLEDQVYLVIMREPPGIQLQDLLRRPFRSRRITEKSSFETFARAAAWWQMRICNLPACLEHTRLRCDELRFNLVLSDPIERYLDESAGWRGIGGEYVVTLGPASAAERGRRAELPTLTASVNAFTRLWLGVRPASSLAFTDDIAGPPELLSRLDEALCLPPPHPDWDL